MVLDAEHRRHGRRDLSHARETEREEGTVEADELRPAHHAPAAQHERVLTTPRGKIRQIRKRRGRRRIQDIYPSSPVPRTAKCCRRGDGRAAWSCGMVGASSRHPTVQGPDRAHRAGSRDDIREELCRSSGSERSEKGAREEEDHVLGLCGLRTDSSSSSHQCGWRALRHMPIGSLTCPHMQLAWPHGEDDPLRHVRTSCTANSRGAAWRGSLFRLLDQEIREIADDLRLRMGRMP